MRIAYICADRGIPVAGSKGSSIHVRAVAQALAHRGHDVDLVAIRFDGNVPSGFHPRTHPIPFDRTLKALRRSIDGEGRTVLSSELYSLFLNSSIEERLTKIDQIDRIDAVYERYSLWSVAGIRFAHSRGIPFVLEVNAPLLHEQKTYRELRLIDAAEGIERFLFAEADSIFVPSEELKEHIVSRIGERRRIHVTPNGVDLDRFTGPRSAAPDSTLNSHRPFTVVFVGSLKPWHGIGVLLKAFERLRKRVRKSRLLVVGDGPLRPRIEEVRDRLGPDAVLMTGEVAHDEIPGWLQKADVGVAPYPELDDFYFSPLKVVEYMASGLPVVASSIGQLRSLIRDEHSGLLVEPGNVDQLQGALARLAGDRKLRTRLGRRARDRARRKHDWNKVAARIEAAIERRLAKAELRQVAQDDAVDQAALVGGLG